MRRRGSTKSARRWGSLRVSVFIFGRKVVFNGGMRAIVGRLEQAVLMEPVALKEWTNPEDRPGSIT
jgi:hypothetical protein